MRNFIFKPRIELSLILEGVLIIYINNNFCRIVTKKEHKGKLLSLYAIDKAEPRVFMISRFRSLSLCRDSVLLFCHSLVTLLKKVTPTKYQALPDSTRQVGTHFPYALLLFVFN